MVFSSIVFLFYFLPAFLFLYLFLPPLRSCVIVFGSFVFYAWGEPAYILLLAAVILMNWIFGLWLEKTAYPRLVLVFGVAGNLSLLVWFKYLGFLCTQIDRLLTVVGVAPLGVPMVPLPLGVSFFTFQAISYLIDIHRGEVAAQPSLLKFAMYKTMFPQLIAGPIVRYREIAAEIDNRTVSIARWRRGIEIFVLGLAQKVLIANPVSLPVDQIFALPAPQLMTATAWFGSIGYMVQIFFDFSGYTTMAIGLGHMMGFTLPRNFDRPYTAQSVTDFWRRWHITLSRWFRDYLYIPLGGNRRGELRTYLNLLTVFVLCGLWHGASWTFALWGLYHGCFLIIERVAPAGMARHIWRPLRHLYLLLVVLVGWVLFRSDTLDGALSMLRAMAGFGSVDPAALPLARFATPTAVSAMVAAAVLVAGSALIGWWAAFGRSVADIAGASARPSVVATVDGVRAASVLLLLVLSGLVLSAETYNPFIYFRF
jgi:alginate O-acetyltransferase complex protein AlgI